MSIIGYRRLAAAVLLLPGLPGGESVAASLGALATDGLYTANLGILVFTALPDQRVRPILAGGKGRTGSLLACPVELRTGFRVRRPIIDWRGIAAVN